MILQVHGEIKAAVVEDIQEEISGYENLKQIMSWAFSQPKGTFLPQVVSHVIVQDEFTHDVVVPRTDGLVLVFDTT